jgi:hypothetical protein
MPDPRKLKVFVASPDDVNAERDALGRLIGDINDVLTFLVPDKQLSLELVRYETHAYPDLGAPQDVIDRQIPVDYDIFVGIMWKRCGTPTKNAPSGTIAEFRRAREHRKSSPLPRIMFYFCDQPVDVAGLDIEQLGEVLKFRKEIDALGLTWNYPSHSEFAEHVRGGMLRAIRDILREETRSTQALPEQGATAIDAAAWSQIVELADLYDQIRRDMPSGDPRTQRMREVFSKMKAKASGVLPMLQELQRADSAGRRLSAVAILQMFPRADQLNWLAQRLDPDQEKPFIGYQAAMGLLEAVRSLRVEHCADLQKVLQQARALAERLTGDEGRLKVLSNADRELAQRCEANQQGQTLEIPHGEEAENIRAQSVEGKPQANSEGSK